MKPFFSIIMPMFNGAAYLTDALESIRGQTYSDYELLCIDDGSSDDSMQIARDFSHHFPGGFTLLERPPTRPKGAGACRNHGAENASGEWLAFLDADDIWLPHHLEQAASIIQASETIGVYTAMGEAFCEGETRGVLPTGGFPADGIQDATPLLLERMFISTTVSCVRRSLLEQTRGFAEDLRCYEDWYCFLQLATRAPFYFQPDCEVRIRMRPGSLTREGRGGNRFKPSDAMFRDQLKLWQTMKKQELLDPEAIQTLRSTVKQFCRGHLVDAGVTLQLGESFRIIRSMFSAGPACASTTFSVMLDATKILGARSLQRMTRRTGT